ncbi:MAG: hypothetical protein WCX69_01855 [Candidatus Paceibacterota bacterium]
MSSKKWIFLQPVSKKADMTLALFIRDSEIIRLTVAPRTFAARNDCDSFSLRVSQGEASIRIGTINDGEGLFKLSLWIGSCARKAKRRTYFLPKDAINIRAWLGNWSKSGGLYPAVQYKPINGDACNGFILHKIPISID